MFVHLEHQNLNNLERFTHWRNCSCCTSLPVKGADVLLQMLGHPAIASLSEHRENVPIDVMLT